MTQFPHDQFAKNLLESLLAPLGQIDTSLTMNSEVREIDVYFTPRTTDIPSETRFTSSMRRSERRIRAISQSS